VRQDLQDEQDLDEDDMPASRQDLQDEQDLDEDDGFD